MNLTLSKIFTVNIQQEDAEMIIQLLAKQKNSKAQQLAVDLNDRYKWNYRDSALR